MYRSVTLKVLRTGIDPKDRSAVVKAAQTSSIEIRPGSDGNVVLLDGEDVTTAIRHPDVTRSVSAVSSYQGVRDVMVEAQRRLASQGGAVLEGRDIGTVVLPGADLKVFMVADVHARAQRRLRDLADAGIAAEEEALVDEIQERDRKDSTRTASPLRKADDAVEVDTSNLTIGQQVSVIVEKAREILKRRV